MPFATMRKSRLASILYKTLENTCSAVNMAVLTMMAEVSLLGASSQEDYTELTDWNTRSKLGLKNYRISLAKLAPARV